MVAIMEQRDIPIFSESKKELAKGTRALREGYVSKYEMADSLRSIKMTHQI